MAIPNKYGVWGYGTLNPNDLNSYSPYNIKGYHFTLTWRDIKSTQAGAYSWSDFDSKLTTLATAGLYIGFQIQVAPSPSTPTWILNHANIGSFTTSGGTLNGPWPNYLSATYISFYYQLFTDVMTHIATLPEFVIDKILYWHVAEGSTGDTSPYKGTPDNNNPYPVGNAISEDDWKQFRRDAWDAAQAAIDASGLTGFRLLVNPGNDGEDLEHVTTELPTAFHKTGDLSHRYSFVASGVYFTRENQFEFYPFDSARSRGEGQGFWLTPYWQVAKVKQTQTLIESALTGGLDMLNVPLMWFGQNTNDTRPMAFFNLYDVRNPEDATRGFVSFTDVIDFADLIRFPENATYKPLIDPAQLTQYNNKIINIDSTDDSTEYKDFLKAKAIYTFLNPARITAITGIFGTNGNLLGAAYDPVWLSDENDRDVYNHDYVVKGVINYGKFVTQINPNTTSIGKWRVGPIADINGRYTRQFIISGGIGEMFFTVDPNLENPDIDNQNCNFIITYYDTGDGRWALNTANCRGTREAFVMQNVNSNTWKSVTVNVNDVLFGGLLANDADFTLRYLGGSNTQFQRVEFQNTSKVV